MIWNISSTSVRTPLPVVMLFAILTVLGIKSFHSMSVDELPSVNIPVISIITVQPGAAPTELEMQVTKPIEDSVASIRGIRHISSTVGTDGVSYTYVQFRADSMDEDEALNKVKDRVSAIRSQFPKDVQAPYISKIEIHEDPIISYAISSKSMLQSELAWFVKDKVTSKLRAIDGFGEIELIGGLDREIHVDLVPNKLLAYGITADSVNKQVFATNFNFPAGISKLGEQNINIRTLSGATEVSQIASMPVRLPYGGQVRLDKLAKISDSLEKERNFALIDDKSAIIFHVSKDKGASSVSVAERVTKEINELQDIYPNVEFKEVDNQTNTTLSAYRSTLWAFFEGAVLTVLIVFFFLRDIRATLISALALPLSIIPTFWVMDILGFTINKLSLLAITIVTGILVDDAIVEIENIARHMRTGKKPYNASMEAADEIGLAVVAISLTIIAIFVPVGFMGGIPGQYFRQFGITVAVSVFISLLVARLVTPVMSAYFLKDYEKTDQHKESRILKLYTQLVTQSIKYRWLTVTIGGAFLITSIAATIILSKDFMPSMDDGRELLSIEVDARQELADLKQAARDISSIIKDVPEVTSVLAYGEDSINAKKATLVIRFTDKSSRSISEKELIEQISSRLYDYPDIKFSFQDETGPSVELELVGQNLDAVKGTAKQLLKEMETVPILKNPQLLEEFSPTELHIIPKQQFMAELGVLSKQLADITRIATISDSDLIPSFISNGRSIPIRVALDEQSLTDLSVLKSLKIPAKGNTTLVPLSALSDFKIGQGHAVIKRHDRNIKVTLISNLNQDIPLGQAHEAIMDLPTAKNLPEGIAIHTSGQIEIMDDINTAFMQAMISGLMIVYITLTLLFGGLIHPLTILISLPFSIGGTIFALLITNNSMSLPVVIGILMLLGIVTKNAILLVDFAITEMSKGLPNIVAIVEATRKRARPIIMTTCAMIAGMIPLALFSGEGAAFNSPMAIAVIGGLIASTVLSLLFVPAIFTLMDDLRITISRNFKKWTNAPDATSLNS